MPASFWERDAAYRKRIGLIVPVVVAVYAILFIATGRFQYEDIPRFIGWKGELEILPEITVMPELATIATEPRPNEEVARETVALDLAPKGEMPADTEQPTEQTEIQPRPVPDPGVGKAEIRSMDNPGHRAPVSYSDKFALIRAVEPVYPMDARIDGIEGMVTVEMLVNENGFVEEANVLSLMGPDSFEESALNAVRQFLFEPPTENGQP
ncbi:MAG TPA: TonB family protein, partial [Candidatus Krumholzibacteria bacterium]|nr:TonB family protein [Candidatus Krumholzibacteria bacterium]